MTTITAKKRVAFLTKRINTNVVFGLSVEKVQRIYNRKLGVNVSYYVAKADLQNLVDKAEAFKAENGNYFSKSVATLLGKTLRPTLKVEPTPLQGNPAYLSQQEREAREYPQVTELCIIHDVQGTLIIEYKGCIFASYKEAQEYFDATLRPQRYQATWMDEAALFTDFTVSVPVVDMGTSAAAAAAQAWRTFRGSYVADRS